MTSTGGFVDAIRLAQDAVERLALVRDRDALARRIEMRQREVAALDRLHVRGLHLRHVVHEQELAEMVVDAGALQMLARADELLRRQRLAPHRLVHARRVADHAPHQSFQIAMPAVTSSKSVSATPFATKRGAQCAIADLTSASMRSGDYSAACVAALRGFFAQ